MSNQTLYLFIIFSYKNQNPHRLISVSIIFTFLSVCVRKMYKSKLQELCQQHSWSSPEYTAVKEGPDHNPKFTATVTVNSVQFHTPSDHQCRSSKDAQNQAAKIAFDHFTAPKSILQHHSSSSSSNSSSPPAPPNPNLNATPSSTGKNNGGFFRCNF